MIRAFLALFTALSLGSVARPADPEVFGVRTEGTPEGLRLKIVFRDTPAHQMGLREGGLLVKVRQKDVRTSRELEAALGELSGEIEVIYKPRGSAKEFKIAGKVQASPTGKFTFVRDRDSQDPLLVKP